MNENENETMTTEERERADARQYILDGLENGDSPFDILDGLAGFYDGDPCDLF